MTTFIPYNPVRVANWRAGGVDDNGQPPEIAVSNGSGNPCRSCLCDIASGQDMLILGARPFAQLNPYAEAGPVFFCKNDCTPFAGAGMPSILTTSPDYLLKAYSGDDRIIYGTGQITKSADIIDYAGALLERDDVAFVDVRSARNNCFQTRIVRSQ